jgi:hypothetical protein
MQVIIYKQDNGVIAVMTPTEECLASHGIQAIALKDVPTGKPFKIIDSEILPEEWPQELWDVDTQELTDGVGSELSTFPESEEQL